MLTFTRSSTPSRHLRSAADRRSTGTASPTSSPSACSSGSPRCACSTRRGTPSAAGRRREIEDLLFFGVLGVIIGGRLGYVLFYKPELLRRASARDLRRLEGRHVVPRRPARRARARCAVRRARASRPLPRGDRPHRAVRAARARRRGASATSSTASCGAAPADPSLPWAMVFPQSGSMVPRHPSQLYQFALEGVLLFVLLWLYARKPAPARPGVGGLPGRLRRVPLHRRILPRARRVPRPAARST